jgi:hypothetical protein
MALYVQVDINFFNSKKVIKGARILGITSMQFGSHMIALWAWSMTNAKDGILNDLEAEDIATASGYSEDAEKFLQTIIRVGFVDKSEVLTLHNWQERSGKILELQEKDRIRAKEKYTKKTGESTENPKSLPGESTENPKSLPGESQILCSLTKPNLTELTNKKEDTSEYRSTNEFLQPPVSEHEDRLAAPASDDTDFSLEQNFDDDLPIPGATVLLANNQIASHKQIIKPIKEIQKANTLGSIERLRSKAAGKEPPKPNLESQGDAQDAPEQSVQAGTALAIVEPLKTLEAKSELAIIEPEEAAKKPTVKQKREANEIFQVYTAYATGMKEKWGVDVKPAPIPMRHFKNLINKIGFQDALLIAEYFPTCRNKDYTTRGHDPQILLEKASLLMGEAQTGIKKIAPLVKVMESDQQSEEYNKQKDMGMHRDFFNSTEEEDILYLEEKAKLELAKNSNNQRMIR